jgi:glutamate--cysteine ligase
MMKRTATVQANLDFVSEADAVAKMRLGLGVGPLVTALYAASPLVDGKESGFQSYRASCWLDTDPDRCGILPFMFQPDAGFAAYTEWALDVPMFFVYRHGTYTPAAGLTFRRFLHEGAMGEHATLADWELHLSTLFPEARLKQYVELRSADAGPLAMIRALPALWRGLFYCADAQAAAWALVADLSVAEREQLRREVPRAGLVTRLRGREIAELCVELVRIAQSGLRALGGTAGISYLEPMLDAAIARRCPADDILDSFRSVGGNPREFVEKIRIRL